MHVLERLSVQLVAQLVSMGVDESVYAELKQQLADLENARMRCAGHIAFARQQTSDELEIDEFPLIADGNEGAFVASWLYVPNYAVTKDDEETSDLARQRMR